jgi:hypothetical protein
MVHRAIYHLEQARAAIERDAPTCAGCKKAIDDGDDYRCWDCKGLYCGQCVKAHFGQRHQPHPLLVRQIHEGVSSLVARFRARLPSGGLGEGLPDDADALALFRCEEVLRRLPLD